MWGKSILFLLFLMPFSFCKEKVENQFSTDSLSQENTDREHTIILTTLDWQPYIGQDLRDYGYVYQLVKEVYESKGYKVQIQFYPWARTMNKASSGEADGYFPEYYNEELAKNFYFSLPYPGGPAGFYGRKDIRYEFKTQYDMKDFTALIPYSIGVVRGYTNTKYFDEAKYLKKQETVDDLSNLKKLYYNRVQLIFIDPNVARYLILNYLLERYPDFFNRTYFLEPELEYKYLYVCINKKVPLAKKKIIDFNEGLKEFQKTGRLKQILYQGGFNDKGIWKP
ncbi:MAG: substrate-binding periplasmic protein [Leptonema sp. (in: bacteria)]